MVILNRIPCFAIKRNFIIQLIDDAHYFIRIKIFVIVVISIKRRFIIIDYQIFHVISSYLLTGTSFFR